MNKTLKIFLITITSFGLYFVLDDIYFKAVRKGLNEIIKQGGISHIIAYAIFGIPIILGSILIHNVKGFIGSLGLDKSITKEFCFLSSARFRCSPDLQLSLTSIRKLRQMTY